MRQSIHIPKPLVLEEGYFSEDHYDNYEMMEKSATNWSYNCTYRIKPDAFTGSHRVLQLSTMQLGYVSKVGGMMNDSYSASSCITIGVVVESTDKACFHRTKLHKGDICFSDNDRPYNLITNDHIKLVVINIPVNVLKSYQLDLSHVFHHTIKDTDNIFSKTADEIWEQFTNNPKDKIATQAYIVAENKIISVLKKLLKAQIPKTSKLTKGEEIALTIRDQVYAHMDGNISIESLAEQYNVSERTLQKSFKSLFGFAPTYFLRQMKLNLVHRDLKYANAKNEKVSRIAQKWGFMHMGRFSKYYAELFGENPSQTLTRFHTEEDIIVEDCVERKEEI